jgi:GH24 family phage-related lysozyme (muramidase)
VIPPQAVLMIIGFETNALSPYVPRHSPASGVTLGIGYDMAHHDKTEIARDWGSHLVASDVEMLQLSTSLVGEHARRYCDENLQHLRIRPEMGLEVFERASLPKYEAQARKAFPGCEELPDLCYGALVSLVFNRGPGMGAQHSPSWESRREMRWIRKAIEDQHYETIPRTIQQMKRLWIDKGLDGLLTRRDAEADMFLSGLRETE